MIVSINLKIKKLCTKIMCKKRVDNLNKTSQYNTEKEQPLDQQRAGQLQ